MTSKETQCHVFEKGIAKEFEAIKFYMDNLEHFNYAENRKALNELILESFDHAKWLAEQILECRKEEHGTIPSVMREEALEEERGMQELYRYELEHSDDAKVKSLMKKLVKEEKEHETLVKSLK